MNQQDIIAIKYNGMLTPIAHPPPQKNVFESISVYHEVWAHPLEGPVAGRPGDPTCSSSSFSFLIQKQFYLFKNNHMW